jgi:hypothetical protein
MARGHAAASIILMAIKVITGSLIYASPLMQKIAVTDPRNLITQLDSKVFALTNRAINFLQQLLSTAAN